MAKNDEPVVRDAAPAQSLRAAEQAALDERRARRPPLASKSRAHPAARPPRRPAAEVLAGWDGWATLSERARPELDEDGYIYADGRALNALHETLGRYLADVLEFFFRGRRVAVQREMFLHFRQRHAAVDDDKGCSPADASSDAAADSGRSAHASGDRAADSGGDAVVAGSAAADAGGAPADARSEAAGAPADDPAGSEEEKEPGGFVGPDLFVTFDVEPVRDLSSHKVWERGVPSFVAEVLSESTRGRDVGEKKDLYRSLGVAEYLLHDPWGDWLPANLVLCRLSGGDYEELVLPGEEAPERLRVLVSEVLGVEFYLGDEGTLRLRDAQTGEEMLGHKEEALLRRVEAARADAAEEREVAQRARADAERERANTELERANTERARADAERERANTELERANTEHQRAEREAGKRRAADARADAERVRADQEAEKRRAADARAKAAEALLAKLQEPDLGQSTSKQE